MNLDGKIYKLKYPVFQKEVLQENVRNASTTTMLSMTPYCVPDFWEGAKNNN